MAPLSPPKIPSCKNMGEVVRSYDEKKGVYSFREDKTDGGDLDNVVVFSMGAGV
jgi:hypothetical protein